MKRKLLLSGLSLLLTLLLAELALRLLGVGAAGRGSPWYAGGNHPRFLFVPDAASGYTLRPGFSGRQISMFGEFDVPVAVDGRGLRDHPHTAPPTGAVLAVGDSMTFGEGVEVEAAWPAVLERASGRRVVNAGVPGYGTPQMRGRLERLLPEVRPALVVATLSPLWDRGRCEAPFIYQDGFIVAQGYAGRLLLIDGNLWSAETRLPVVGPATAYAKRFSRVAGLLLPALAGAARRAAGRSPEEVSSVTPGDLAPSAEALAAMQRRAARAGAGFLAVIVDSDSRGEDHRAARRALEEALRRRGVPFLALDERLPGADWPRLRFPRDGHWNAAGHRAVGEGLVGALTPHSSAKPPGDTATRS